MTMRAFAFSLLSALAVGCDSGGTPVPSLPTASPNVGGTTATPFPFNGGAGVNLGTSGFASITVQNIGSQDMVVSSVTYTGDAAISLHPGVSPATPATIPFDKFLTVGLTCTPVAAGTVTGTLDIKNNSTNLPDISIVMSCLGVKPDAGP